MIRLGSFLRGALLAAALSPVSTAFAEPALWAVRDADTTVYLFGTVHLTSPTAEWDRDAVTAALESSDALWLEIDILGDTSGALAMITEGTSPERPLKDRLSSADYAAVAAAAEEVGLPMTTLDKLRPWLAAVTITAEGVKRAGFDASGVDLTLARSAAARHIPLHGLETGAAQIGFLAGQPEDIETAMLREAAQSLDDGLATFRTMYDAWAAGDLDALEAMLVESLAKADPRLVDTLLGSRNRVWADRFADLMAEPGTRMLAVGAAHTVGPDGLPELLRAKGWRVDRVDGG